MITQTLAIFVDAYRELNAKRMFWIVLVLSALVVVVFAAAGVENDELTFFGRRTAMPMPFEPAEFYRYVFSVLGIGIWLAIAASILALVSTAGIFPEFVSGGAVDLYLSKPISRLRLFLTKYAAGLLFVALQVTVFAAASFLVLGWRGGEWEPRVFLAVPIVVCFFSYLFCVCVLVGVITRSTVAAILLTVLFWFVLFILHMGEIGLLAGTKAFERQRRATDVQLKVVDRQIAFIERQPPAQRQATAAQTLASLREQRQRVAADREVMGDGGTLRLLHRIVFGLKTILPKTSETTNLLNRSLLSEETLLGDDAAQPDPEFEVDVPATEAEVLARERRDRRRRRGGIQDADVAQMNRAVNERSPRYVIGTSLGFEAVVLALAAWVFCRRDY